MAFRKNEVKLVLSADSRRLNMELNRSRTNIKRFHTSLGSLQRSGRTISRTFLGLKGLAGAYGLYRAGKAILDYNTTLRKLVVQAGKTKEGTKKIFELKKELDELANITHQRPEKLASALDAIVERTGNLDMGVQALKAMGIVATASTADMEGLGATASNLIEKMGIKPTGILEVFDILASQGKQGSFTLQNMANLFERLLSAAGRVDIKGIEGIRRFGAFLQIAKRGTGTAEQAATAIERTISNIIAKSGELEKIIPGIIFKKDDKGIQQFRDFDLILKDIIRVASKLGKKKGGIFLQKFFGDEGVRAIEPLAKSFREHKGFSEFDKFVKFGGDTKTLMEDFNFMAADTAKKVEDVTTKVFESLNKILTPERIESIGKALDKLNETVDRINKSGSVSRYMLGPEKPQEPYKLFGPLTIPRYNPVWERSLFFRNLFGLDNDEQKKVEIINNIGIRVDEHRRVTTTTDNMKTKNNVTLDPGNF